MKKTNFDMDKYLVANSKSLKDYISLVRTNLKLFSAVLAVTILLGLLYAILSKNIYKSTVDLKISKQKQSILETQTFPDLGGAINDRFIANEIEIIRNYDSRERYASALIDSFNNSNDKSLYSLLRKKDSNEPRSLREIAQLLSSTVTAEQLDGLDIIQIFAESPSPYEAALIANTCADQYKKLNLENNRGQLSTVRKFLEEQSKEKMVGLNEAEDALKNFQQQGGIVSLDAQSTALINQLANLDAQKDAAKVDLMTSSEVLKQYKQEMQAQDPQLANYLESQTSQTYIDALQKQIAGLQMNKDLALSNKNSNVDVSAKIKEYDTKITELKQKLNSVINDIKAGAYASSPEQIKELTQKLIEEKVKNNSLQIKYNEVQNLLAGYEENFNRLPKKSIELAQYQRRRESMQQLYLLVEQKYQEALIEELSQPGNAVIVAKGRVADSPDKPNRFLIVILSLVGGFIIAFVSILSKDYFDDSLKTPDEIEQEEINLLSWIPYVKKVGDNYFREHELGNSGETDSVFRESFKSLRARIQFSKANQVIPFKTILVTSSAAEEGKTLVSVNLAASYVRADHKTLLIDCDLIKPKVHNTMGVKRSPGLTDYLEKKINLESIINKSGIIDLDYIPAGSICKNTDRLLASNEMKKFLETIRDMYDIIIIDSAPIIPVIDTQILSRLVDTTILVVSAGKTETVLMNNSIEMLKKESVPFLGVVFNGFRYKDGHHYYHKYYYNYSSNGRRHSLKEM